MNWHKIINLLVQIAVFFIDKQHKKDTATAERQKQNLDKIDEQIIKQQNSN